MSETYSATTRHPQATRILAIAAALAAAANVQAQTRPQGQYAEVNGIRLYYEVHGPHSAASADGSAAPPLVLLHGGLAAIEIFEPILPALAAGRRVVAVDLQGHGRTADIDRPLDVRFMADDIAALIEHLGIGPADVMGYSLGGAVALQTAIRHPAVVRRLVTVSTVFRQDGYYPDMLQQQASMSAAAAEAMKQTPMYGLYAAVAPRPEDWPRLLDKIGAALRQDFDFSREIPTIRARTLIVAGDADMFPPSHAVEMFALLGGGRRDGGWDRSGVPNARLAILPGRTHYDIAMDPALAATVIAFLDEPDGPGH